MNVHTSSMASICIRMSLPCSELGSMSRRSLPSLAGKPPASASTTFLDALVANIRSLIRPVSRITVRRPAASSPALPSASLLPPFGRSPGLVDRGKKQCYAGTCAHGPSQRGHKPRLLAAKRQQVRRRAASRHIRLLPLVSHGGQAAVTLLRKSSTVLSMVPVCADSVCATSSTSEAKRFVSPIALVTSVILPAS